MWADMPKSESEEDDPRHPQYLLKGPRVGGKEDQESPFYWLKVLEIVASKEQAVYVAQLKKLFEDEEREQEQGVKV